MSLARSIALKARADLAQQLVAGVMAERVVELLEVVEVEDQQRHARAAGAARGDAVAQPPQERRRFGSDGEIVGERLPASLGERADVAEGERHAREGGEHGDHRQRQAPAGRGG